MINLQSLGLVPINDNSPVPVTPPPQRGGSRLAKLGLVPIEEPAATSPLADLGQAIGDGAKAWQDHLMAGDPFAMQQPLDYASLEQANQSLPLAPPPGASPKQRRDYFDASELITGDLAPYRKQAEAQAHADYLAERDPVAKKERLIDWQVQQRHNSLRKEQIAAQQADMRAQGVENPLEYAARETAAKRAKNPGLPLEGALDAMSTGVAEPFKALVDWAAGDRAATMQRRIDSQQEEAVQQELDKTSPLGATASGLVRNAAGAMGQMAPSLAISAATGNPAAGLAAMAGGAGLSAYNEHRADGNSVGKSLAYGTTIGAIEALTEGMGQKMATALGVQDLLQSLAKPMAKRFSDAIMGAGIEGVEEMAAEGADMVADFAYGNRDHIFDKDSPGQIFKAGVLGFMLGGFGQVQSVARYYAMPTKEAADAIGLPEDVANSAKERQDVAATSQAVAEASTPEGKEPPPRAPIMPMEESADPNKEAAERAWMVAKQLGATREQFDALASNFDPRSEDEWQQVLTPFRDEARKRTLLARQRRQAAPTDDVWKIVPANAEQIAELRKKGFRGKALAGLTQGEYSQIVNGNWTPAKLREYRRSQRATADSPPSAEQAAAPPAPEQLAPEVGVPPTDSMQAPGAEVAALPAEQPVAPQPVEQAAPVVEAAPPVAQEPVDPYPGRKRKLTDATPERGEAWLRNTLKRSPSGLDAAGVSAWIRKGFGDDHYWAALQNRKQTLEQYVAEQMGQPVAEAPVAPVAEAPPAVAPPAPKPKNKLGAKKPTPIAVTPEDVGIGDRPPVNPDYGAAYPDGAKAMGQHADLDAVEFAIREQVGDAKITQEPGEDYVAFKVNGKPLYEALIQGNGEWLLLKKPETVEPAASTPPPLPSTPPPLPQKTATKAPPLTAATFRSQLDAVAAKGHITPEQAQFLYDMTEARATAAGESVDDYVGKRIKGVDVANWEDFRGQRGRPGGVLPEKNRTRQDDSLGHPAYHGSPYKFDKFTTDKIGSGEGAQAYGWGLYFAGAKKVAEWYRSKLGSRAAGSRAKNDILAQKNGGFRNAEIEFLKSDGRAVIRAFESADFVSMVHELGHLFRRDLAGPDMDIAAEWAGAKPGEKWSRQAEEKFAKGFEQYMLTGKAPTPKLTTLFAKIADWMRAVYKATLRAPGVEISPAMREVFDRLFAAPEAPKPKRSFRGKKAPTAPPVQGEIGMKLAAGETAITSSGRQTTPFPKFNSSRGLKQVDRWLLENALAEAQSRGDEFNARQFEGDLQGKTIPQASKDAAEQYLFGEQPPVPPPLLKPLVTPPAKNSFGRKKAKQKPLEFEEASELKAPSGTASVRSQGAGDTPYTPKTAPNSLVGIPAPELFQLAKELLGGKIPMVRKMAKALGRFRYMEGVPSHSEILLNPSIAKTEQALTATLAHEIGHLIDYLPEGTLKRGNLLGRVATLRKYLKGYLDGVGSNKEIKAELIELTKWWSGDWEGADPAYKKYRESSRELYAEALSVFLNTPGDLEQRAPTFWKGFTEHLNKKPQVLQAYLEAQQLMAGTPEALAAKWSQNIREMFERGDEAIRASTTALSVARRSSVESIKQALEMAMLDKTSPIKRRVSEAKKRGYDPADRSNPYYLLDELGNVDSDNYVMLSQIERKVDKLLEPNGLTRGDIGEYLFTRRIVNERNEILNSLLITPSAAKQLLSHMEQTLGPEKFRALEMATETYHDIIYKQMLNAVDAGLYSQQKLEEKIEPNKYNYATFAVVHYLENSPHISASMREQVGTTSDTANGYDATIMKMMTVNRLAKLNRAKRSIRDFMQQWFPQEITQVDVPYNDNKPSMPAPHGMEYLLMLEDGKPQAWAVPKSIVDMFKSHDVGQLAALGAFVQTELYGTLHPLLVTFNPNFQVQNPGRDIRRTYANLGAIGDAMYADKVQELVASGLPEKTAKQIAKSKRITLGQVLKAYWKTKGIAWRRAAGLHDDYIEMMVKNGALDVPFVQVDPAIIGEKGAAKYLMAQYGMADAKEAEHPSRIRRKLGKVASKGAEASKYVLGPLGFQAGTESASPGLARKALQKLGDLTEFVGVMQETHAKVAGNLLLEERGVPVKQRSWMVRKYVGTPDTRQRGLYTAITNSFSLYHKVKLNGLQWDADLAFDSKTAAGWWARKVTTTVIPTILTKLASYGALGLGIKAVLDAIPNYYLDTYNILALPWMLLGGDDDDEKGKAIFITVAQDETSQIISRLTALAMDAGATVAGVETRRKSVGDSATEAVGVLADAVGMSPNPYISIAYRWGLFAMGINPVDPHYQAPIVPPTEFEAGDIWKGDFSAVRKMGAWTAGQFGVASTVGHAVTGGMLGETFESDKQESSLEYFLRSTPGLSRFVRISDRGYTEEHWAGVKAEEREHKRFLLGLPQHARAATKKLMYLRDRTAELTPKEWHDKNLLSNWYSKVYLPATRELPKANQERRQQLMANLDRSLDEIRKDREQPVALRYLEMALLSNDRPSKTDEESQEAYDARLAAWETSLELATGWLEANKGSEAVQSALGEVRRTKAFQRLRTGLPTTFGQRRKQQQANRALRMLAP